MKRFGEAKLPNMKLRRRPDIPNSEFRIPNFTVPLLYLGAVILFVYLIVLVMNFFISSGSAKAFLLMPLIVPICQVFQISSQLSVMAFAFGDGFSNVLYPTNPVLLISLGVAGVSYTKWFKWSGKIQLAILVVTSLLLLFGLSIGYN